MVIAEIISKYQVSKSAIHEWKKLVLDNGTSIFGQKKEVSSEKQVEQLHKIIGKLKVENDFLQDAWNKSKPCRYLILSLKPLFLE